jgi:predicted DNA-binding transcriptional regulator AlpA
MVGKLINEEHHMPRLISKRETAEIVGFHPEHVMRLVRAGQFPRPIKTSSTVNCAVRFVADEVDAWIGERMAARQ